MDTLLLWTRGSSPSDSGDLRTTQAAAAGEAARRICTDVEMSAGDNAYGGPDCASGVKCLNGKR